MDGYCKKPIKNKQIICFDCSNTIPESSHSHIHKTLKSMNLKECGVYVECPQCLLFFHKSKCNNICITCWVNNKFYLR